MRFIIIFFLVLISEVVCAQELKNNYNSNISVEYGLFASLNSGKYENLTGNKTSISGTYYYPNNFGFKSGMSIVNNLEGSYKYYAVPIQLAYKTLVYNPTHIYVDAETFTEFLFKLIFGIMPKQYEFYLGTSLGYVDPDNNISLVSINGGPWYEEGFIVNQRFAATIDFNVTGRYQIGQFGILISPGLSYMVTKNFKYKSEVYTNMEFNPGMFLSLTFGLSYKF